MSDGSNPQWELDRKIPIAIIIAIVSQFAFSIWYASKMDSRVSLLETEFLTIVNSIGKLDTAREQSAIQATKNEDKAEQIYNVVNQLLNRSDYLHPELSQHDQNQPAYPGGGNSRPNPALPYRANQTQH